VRRAGGIVWKFDHVEHRGKIGPPPPQIGMYSPATPDGDGTPGIDQIPDRSGRSTSNLRAACLRPGTNLKDKAGSVTPASASVTDPHPQQRSASKPNRLFHAGVRGSQREEGRLRPVAPARECGLRACRRFGGGRGFGGAGDVITPGGSANAKQPARWRTAWVGGGGGGAPSRAGCSGA